MRAKINFLLVLLFSASLHAADAQLDLSADEQAIVDQTNALRQKAGKAPLKPSCLLFAIARKHAQNMASQKKLEHRMNGKNSADRADAAGYKWTTVSENIAWNQRTVEEVLNGWMQSDGHRANLLSSEITEMGAAVAKNDVGELYWVQVFARPQVAERYVPRPIVVRPGAVATTIRFSIHNLSNVEMKVNVGAEKLYEIKPGETVTYALTTAEAKPAVEVKSGITTLEFIAQNGTKYSVTKKGNDMRLEQAHSETQ